MQALVVELLLEPLVAMVVEEVLVMQVFLSLLAKI